MVEQHSFGRGEDKAKSTHSNPLEESFLTLEKLVKADGLTSGDLLHRAVETSESFHKTLQEAYDLINPLVRRINALSPELRKELVASIPDKMTGYAYDAVREHCT